MNVKLAFKKDSDSWISKLIKWYTKSKYSHVEIIVPSRDGDFESGFWLSANAKKGVRIKPLILPLNNNSWDYIDVEVDSERYISAMERISEITEYKYATLDLFLVQILKLDKMESRKRMFCSESVCEVLRAFNEPKINRLGIPCVNLSPEDLYRLYL
jgi:hypothetical protein